MPWLPVPNYTTKYNDQEESASPLPPQKRERSM
jgi:hypothetical protein